MTAARKKARILRRGVTPDLPVLGLLIELLRDVPRLPGAACRDHPEVFAATVMDGQGSRTIGLVAAKEQARAICASCPALAPCRAWVLSMPERNRPAGVVAGQTLKLLKRTAAQQQSKEHHD